ncbi:MAG: hypothetical protein J6Z00_03200 [Clostridia bacterium]|nr:hypothetical protein [Clostridia bacterium]
MKNFVFLCGAPHKIRQLHKASKLYLKYTIKNKEKARNLFYKKSQKWSLFLADFVQGYKKGFLYKDGASLQGKPVKIFAISGTFFNRRFIVKSNQQALKSKRKQAHFTPASVNPFIDPNCFYLIIILEFQ